MRNIQIAFSRETGAGKAWRLLFSSALVLSHLTFASAPMAEEILAHVIADGKPWEIYVVKRKRSNILVFRPDGRGTISDGVTSIHPTWEAVPGGMCIRPEKHLERCLMLSRVKRGIMASQNGKPVFILRR
jgi:hypothetical protein